MSTKPKRIKDLPPDQSLGGVRFIYPGDGKAYYWASQWSRGVWGQKNLKDSQRFPLFCNNLEEAMEWKLAARATTKGGGMKPKSEAVTARELNLLERCFTAEVTAALNGSSLDLCQLKSKLADKLCADGFITKAQVVLPGRFPVTVEGYRLTPLGHFTYCSSQPDIL